jgi:uncharacterized protein (TIGR00369 family)
MEGDGAAQVSNAERGEFAGWSKFGGEDFEEIAGPFFWRRDPDGRIRCAFRAEQRHMNAGGRMHGGCLMTFADMALFAIAREEMGGSRGVTVALDNQFLDAARVGDLLEATGEVTRAGGSLIFARGTITVEQRLLLTFSGVIKKFRPKPPG